MSRNLDTRRALIVGGALLGVALVVVAFWVPVTRVPGGGLTRQGWWVAQAGVAIAVGAPALRAAWRRSAALTALLVLGVAGQLELTHPLWLQFVELRPGHLRHGTAPLGVAALALQALTVGALVLPRVASIRDLTLRLLTPRALWVGALMVPLVGVHWTLFARSGWSPSSVGGYAAQLITIAGCFVLNVAHLGLVVEALPQDAVARARAAVSRCLTLPGEQRPATRGDRILPWAGALFVLAFCTFVAVVVLERVPHIPDSAGYLFHAKCLASGALDVPAPPVPEAFSVYLLEVRDGRWLCTMNPGWPAVLAIGERLGAPWAVNPILAAATVLPLHALVTRVVDRGTAHVAVLLTVTSPWYLFLGASLMTHTLTLALVVGAWALLARWDARGSRVAVVGAGMLLGYVAAVRTLDGVIACGTTGAWMLLARPRRWRSAVLLVVGGAAGGGWLLAYNAHFTGSPLHFPLNDYYDRLWYPGANRLGFGADVGNPPQRWWQLDPFAGHGPVDVLLNANQNLYNVNFELHGWAVGSLLLPAAYLLQVRLSRIDRWLLAYVAAVCGAYSLYWFSGGPDFGARYWFLIFPPCLWWSLHGARVLVARLRTAGAGDLAGPRIAAAVALLCVLTLTTFVPWRIVARYDGYRNAHGEFRDVVADPALRNALVLVETRSEPEFCAAFSLNSPYLDADRPVFARRIDDATSLRLREAFPGRPVVRVRGRSVEKGQHVVIVREP